MNFNILDYGAVGDGAVNDGPSIQAAIDACHETGGGRVLVPGGKIYRSGSIVLKSNVELHLEMGAVLKGSSNLGDYDLFGIKRQFDDKLETPTYENCDYDGRPALYFIFAKDCENISLTGFGKIDGNEEIFYGKKTPWHIDGSFYPRVPMLFLENVTHLTMLHISLTGSAFWTVHLVGCRDVLIDGIRILNNLRLANCDGIDPDHCCNVRITNCHIECADDCIVFKNTANAIYYGPCENITVSDCTLISTSAAIKFGTESEGIFRNITVQNCNISRTNRGISLMLRDQGIIENVTFTNLNISTRMFSKEHWWGDGEPIAITALRRNKDSLVGYIRGIRFQNINCVGENGILIHGDESDNIRDITFDHINLRLEKQTDWPKDCHDLRPCEGEGMLTGSLNAVFARNAANVRIKEMSVYVAEDMEEYITHLYDVDNCSGFRMEEPG